MNRVENTLDVLNWWWLVMVVRLSFRRLVVRRLAGLSIALLKSGVRAFFDLVQQSRLVLAVCRAGKGEYENMTTVYHSYMRSELFQQCC